VNKSSISLYKEFYGCKDTIFVARKQKSTKKTKRDAMARAVTSRFVAVGQNG
jgi:hypothetical protein